MQQSTLFDHLVGAAEQRPIDVESAAASRRGNGLRAVRRGASFGLTHRSSPRRYEGPHRFTQKRTATFVTAPQSFAAVMTSKYQLWRDFWRGSIFDFCNTIPLEADVGEPTPHIGWAPRADVSLLALSTARVLMMPSSRVSFWPHSNRGFRNPR
jgi:hypothetical protein